MSKIPLRKPSPALVISLVALFVALGGSAYAASKVGTKDIKANAITTGKIKKNAVTSAKIKNGAVTGAKVKLSSLGTVPSATTAVTATNFSRYVALPITKANQGQTVSLYSNGPFTFFGRCVDIGGGETEALTFVTTSQAGSTMSSYEDNFVEANFNPGTEAQINYEIMSATALTNDYDGSFYQAFTALSADGSTRLRGSLASGVNYFGSPCSFWGDVTINS